MSILKISSVSFVQKKGRKEGREERRRKKEKRKGGRKEGKKEREGREQLFVYSVTH